MSFPARRRGPDPQAHSKAAIRMMKRIDPQKSYKEIPTIVSLVLSIDPRAEVEVLNWLAPVLGSIPWKAVRCYLMSFQRAPVGRWCIAMLHPAVVADFDRIVYVPYSTADKRITGQVAAAIFPGDIVNLPAHPDVWYTVYEIRMERNCLLVASADADVLPNPAKVKSERKIWRNYMEINTIYFLGCIVKREAIIGPLSEVVNDWSPASATTAQLLHSESGPHYQPIFFQIPKANHEDALQKLSALSKAFNHSVKLAENLCSDPDIRRSALFRSASAGVNETALKRKPKVLKQPLLFKPTIDNGNDHPSVQQRNLTRADPVESFQRKKHVQVWAARKMELAVAAKALWAINPNPLLYTLDDTFDKYGDRAHLVDSLLLARKRREVWLQVGRALRAVSRGGLDGHVLLSAWKAWTQRGMDARAALEKKIHRAQAVFGEEMKVDKFDTLEMPNESSCIGAWYSQRLPTNCDDDSVVTARTYIRKRIHELSKYNQFDVSDQVVGNIFDANGNIIPERCGDDICQSILVSAVEASQFISNCDAELHFIASEATQCTENDIGYNNRPSNRTIKVPSAAYTCCRKTEYWQSDLDGNSSVPDDAKLDEITEVMAVIKRGDVLYLPMGKEDVGQDTVMTCTNRNMNAVLQHAPSRWCQVLAVDLLFARLWVRYCSAAPHCWLDDANDGEAGYHVEGVCYWLPVSLLWDAVVFSPEFLESNTYQNSSLATGSDVVKTVTKNGISFLECSYKAFNVPALSSREAINMLQALSGFCPAVELYEKGQVHCN